MIHQLQLEAGVRSYTLGIDPKRGRPQQFQVGSDQDTLLVRVAERERAEAVPPQQQQSDTRMAFPGTAGARSHPLIHLPVPDVGHLPDVFEPLSLGKAPIVPIPSILTQLREEEVGEGLAEVEAIVADQKSQG